MRHTLLGCLCLLVLLAAGGCATQRTVTITTRPPDAVLKIDGVNRGKAPVVHTFEFPNAEQSYLVVAQRPGYKDSTWRVTRDFTGEVQQIDLQPLTGRVTINVGPVPAVVSINGKPVAGGRLVSTHSEELEFTLDARDNWTTYEVTAQRPGYQTARQAVSWPDRQPAYNLELRPLQKNVRITSQPPGATIYLDGEAIGTAPTEPTPVTFEVDPETEELLPRRIRAEKAGFEPVTVPLAWDEGSTDYEISLLPKSKIVQITTDPPAVDLKIEGEAFAATSNADGRIAIDLKFPPVNEEGELRQYKLLASKKPEGDREWYPTELPVAWDNGQTRYEVKLREVLTRPVPLLVIEPRREGEDWTFEGRRIDTLAMKDTREAAGRQPVRIYTAADGELIDSFAVSPDGRSLAMTILPAEGNMPLRTQIRSIQTDGSGGQQQLTTGDSFDLMPSYTPDGRRIVFATNRMSDKLAICSIATTGVGGVTEHTSGDSYDIWPAVDSDPQARLFYTRLMDNRDDTRLYMQQMNGGQRTDLTSRPGSHPRPSPKADAIVFTSPNGPAGKLDLFRLPEGGRPENLTNTPDFDESDAAWSRTGSRLLFVADKARHEETGNNRDIWMLNLTTPDQPVQITTNGSWDDNPAWDPSGNAIYFRSNRGGQWGIWKLSLTPDKADDE